MMTAKQLAAMLLCLLLIGGGASANDEPRTVPYYRAGAFNAPILEGWTNNSSADAAQFELAEAQATIRTALVSAADSLAAARSELRDLLGLDINQPVYDGKVNLADGTWRTLVFDLDEATTASVMARRNGSDFAVITFVERNPAARTLMLAITQADDSRDEADPEIVMAADTLAGISLERLNSVEVIDMPSGAWRVLRRPALTAMGMVFGNESYVAVQEGEPSELAALADAWNRALLGFFITPDNSRYLVLGLAAVFLILGTLVFSFSWRGRGLERDLALIQQLAQAGD